MAFVLVFWEEPPSSSIVHKSLVIGGADLGQKRLVLWKRKQLWATVVRTGTKKDLSGIVLTAEGQVYDPRTGPEGEVARERTAVLDERLRQATVHRSAAQAARSHFLFNLTDEHLQHLPPPIMPVDEPAPTGGALDLIKALPIPLRKDNLRKLMENLPCLRQPEEEQKDLARVSERYDVWLNDRLLWSLGKNFRHKPDNLFRELILACVPPQVLALPFVSAGGTKGTVGVPKSILSAAVCFVGRKSVGAVHNPSKNLLNLIRDARSNKDIQSKVKKLLERPPQVPQPPPLNAVPDNQIQMHVLQPPLLNPVNGGNEFFNHPPVNVNQENNAFGFLQEVNMTINGPV